MTVWVDYNILQYPDGSFTVKGDTDTEVMDKGLYKPGDRFIVNEHGVLRYVDNVPLKVVE